MIHCLPSPGVYDAFYVPGAAYQNFRVYTRFHHNGKCNKKDPDAADHPAYGVSSVKSGFRQVPGRRPARG